MPIAGHDPKKESFRRHLLSAEKIRRIGPRPIRRRQDQTEALGVYRKTHPRRGLCDELSDRGQTSGCFPEVTLQGLLTSIGTPPRRKPSVYQSAQAR